jgi:type I restriction enzyme S subunit
MSENAIVRVADKAKVLMGQSPPSSACSEDGDGLPFIQGNAEFGRRNPSPRLRCSAPTRIAEAGDLLLSVRAPVGELNQAVQRTVIGRGLSAIRFVPAQQGFAWHAVKFAAPGLNRVAQGSTFVAVSREDVERLPIPWHDDANPRIAAALDTVDAAVASTEAVIAKLRQVRAGLLHDLLTRGLDMHGQLRDPIAHPEQFQDSPLGRIPREWDFKRLDEMIASAVDGPFGSNLKTQHYVNQPGVRVVRLQNIETGRFDDSDEAFVSTDHAATLQRHQVVSGDLLVASMGDENHPLARACLYPDEFQPGIVKADCFRLRTKPSMAVHGFIMHFLNCPSTRREMNLLGQGVTRDRVNLTTLLRLRVIRPPVDEQKEIVKRIQALDSATKSETEAHGKLTLLKSGMLTDLLTGRVPVPAEKGN